MASTNKMLGEFELVGIPPAPRGLPRSKSRLILRPMVLSLILPRTRSPTKRGRLLSAHLEVLPTGRLKRWSGKQSCMLRYNHLQY
ncbi:hypothetical protein C1H46_019507 [Malus baccata]|uniref:Uncharacterized protein n=1 Tax=Malus baccata TaxID=106549 RepID=A0A540M8S0_MALBA|nr:hypothetical protein C1H46_019507 [Malus baccata]